MSITASRIMPAPLATFIWASSMRSHRSSSSSGLCWPKRRNSHWSVGNRIFDLDRLLISLCGSLPASAQNAAMAALAHMPLRTMYAIIAATWNAPNSAFLFFENGRPTSAMRPARSASSISLSGIGGSAPCRASFSLPAPAGPLRITGLLTRKRPDIYPADPENPPAAAPQRARGPHRRHLPPPPSLPSHARRPRRGTAKPRREVAGVRLRRYGMRAGRAAERPSRTAPRPRPPGVYKQGNMFNH